MDELERFGEWLIGAETRLLDVGCGAGGPALRLAETIGLSVVGIDILAEGIATALGRSSTFDRVQAFLANCHLLASERRPSRCAYLVAR